MIQPFARALMRDAGVALLGIPLALGAQPGPAQKSVPIVNLPSATASSTETVGAVLGVRQVEGGKLLVDDGGRRQVRLFDASLASSTVVLDSTPGLTNSYGARPTPLVPYVGDSSLFADQKSKTILVFDGRGQIARSMAAVADQDVTWLAGRGSGVDGKGRLIFLGRERGMPFKATTGGVGFRDSLALLRFDFDVRRVDTAGLVSRPLGKATSPTKAPNGVTYTMFAVDPLKTVDDWAVLSDGSIAIVRGQNYHIDWIHRDGAMSSTAKMPFDWKRLTDEEKQKFVDSARAAQNELLATDKFESEITMMTKGDFDGVPGPGFGAGSGAKRERVSDAGGGGGDRESSQLSQTGRGYKTREAEVIPLNQIADYYPPIRPGSTMPDLDDHLWILPTTSAQSQHGELVYDVVNSSGDLFERVRVPAGRSIVGFGRGGIVYLASGDKTNGFHLERSVLPR